MPLIIPTFSYERLKKFPSQAFIGILLILLGYFINVSNSNSKENTTAWKNRALTDERKLDSTNKAWSDFRDALIEKKMENDDYRLGKHKIDSATKKVSHLTKTIFKK